MNSMSIKGGNLQGQQVPQGYDEPLQQIKKIQQSAISQPIHNAISSQQNQNQIQGQLITKPLSNIFIDQTFSGQIPVNVNHKKSNSLINSKMAQLLVKGGVTVGGNNQNLLNNAQSFFQGQPQGIPNQNPIHIHPSQIHKSGNPQNTSNLTSNAIVNQGVSNQNSFLNSDQVNQSHEYQKPYHNVIENDEEIFNGQDMMIMRQSDNHQNYINNLPSNKVIITKQQYDPYMKDSVVNQNQQLTSESFNKQSATKPSSIKMSSSKQSKKQPNPHHQRTKSDNIFNRGSIVVQNTPSQGTKQIQTAQQSKRAGVTQKNNFIDNEPPQSKSKGAYMITGESGSISQTRKAPNSAHHSKKPSASNFIQNNQTTTTQSNASKKSTKEKYFELKAMYNDLLERHYQLANQGSGQAPQVNNGNYQQQHSLNKLPASIPQNFINFYPAGAQNFLMSSSVDSQAIISNTQTQNSTTPRITMTNQNSQSTLQGGIQQNVIMNTDFVREQISRTIKPLGSSKMEAQSTPIENQQQKQARAGLKVQLNQGQSRKAANYHKRSVSDGNEQLFKFKQNVMQRYLYPQPSNQTIASSQIQGPILATEDIIISQRNANGQIQSNQIQGTSNHHQRRVSDDFNQKKKKNQQALNQHGIVKNNQIPSVLENVPLEHSEFHQQAVDFNIKGFLLEMRNKQEGKQQNTIEAAPNSTKKQKQFAMIIEENSPLNELLYHQNSKEAFNSSRKMSLVDNNNYIPKQKQQVPNHNNMKPGQEFNKILQKYKKLRIEEKSEKRASSPHIEKTDFMGNAKEIQQQVSGHKRVKSDVPENIKKNQIKYQQVQPQMTANNNNNIKNNPLYRPKYSHQSSGSNILKSSSKNTPKKGIFDPKQNFSLRQGQLFDGNNSKKIINVSIDLIRDGDIDPLMLEEGNFAGGQWIEVDHNQNVQQVVKEKKSQIYNAAGGNQKQQKPASQGQSGTSDINRQDKYKKMLSKYQGGSENNHKMFNVPEKMVLKTDSSTTSPLMRKDQHKMLFNDKKVTQQLSSPPHSPFKKTIGSTAPISQTKHNPQDFANHNQMLGNSQQYMQISNSQKKALAPTNSVQQTQESQKSLQMHPSLRIQQTQQLERIDTLDSNISDTTYSPRTKAIKKLVKHITLSFKQTGQAPNTTADFYRIGKVLGKGAFGKVNLALHKLSQKFVAVKSINKQYLSEDSQTKKVMQEVVILKRTRHKNIVRLYEFFETQKHILFVIELCAGGDLLNYVRKRRRLKEDVAKSVFKQIIEGLGYCHSRQILHRDIKLDNILLDSEGEVKICDFGVSKIVKKGEKMTEQCGTPAYIAPEILRDKGYEGFSVDIWSSGVVLYAMLYGTVPFKANNMSELQKLIIKAKYTLKDDISEEARDLLEGLLEKDPLKRLTIQQILSHEWLKDAEDRIQLFTDQEKEYIKNEFTYNDAERYNRNEADPFTEHLLDSTQNSMLKNQTSKSIILAPFNSTRSNIENVVTMTKSMKELLQSKNCLKFAPRVRDVDKQYEQNNNAELDNGVFHKFGEDEEEEKKAEADRKRTINSDDSLQSSFQKETIRSDEDEEEIRIRDEKKKQQREKKKKKKEQTELEKLESMIQQEEEDKNDQQDHEQSCELLLPYGAEGAHADLDEHDKKQIKTATTGQDLKRSPRPSVNNINNGQIGNLNNNNNILQSAQTLILDDQVVIQVEQFGYPREYILKCMNNNELNYATTTYYLITNNQTMNIDSYQQNQRHSSAILPQKSL